MILPFLMGAGAAFLWLKHKGRGIDYCNNCKQSGQIGAMVRYLPTETNVQIPYCKKCKPEIFPKTSSSIITGFLRKKILNNNSITSLPIVVVDLLPEFVKPKSDKVKLELNDEVRYSNVKEWQKVADELVSKHGSGVPKVSYVDTDDPQVDDEPIKE